MANLASRNQNHDDKLLYGFDAGFMATVQPPDSPPIPRDQNINEVPDISLNSDSESSSSAGDTNQIRALSSNFRVLSESMMRMEISELETIKTREASRLMAEKRRIEVEMETVGMLLQTQLQIATFLLPRKSIHRKRKRVAEVDSSTSQRYSFSSPGQSSFGTKVDS